eukprot:6869_1
MLFIFIFYAIVSIQFCYAQWPIEIIIPAAPNYIGLSAPSSQELKWIHAQSYCQFHYGTSLATILNASDQAEIEALVVEMLVDNGGGEDGDQSSVGFSTSDSSTENIAWAPCGRTIHEECTYNPCEANTEYNAAWHQHEGSYERDRCGYIKKGNNGGTLGKWVFDICDYLRDFICNAPNGKYSQNINCFPTQSPTYIPTLLPTNIPTIKPTESPLAAGSPTRTPTNPTIKPSISPSINPTQLPSITPTNNPSNYPSISPTYFPSLIPTKQPTMSPTKEGEVNQILSTEINNKGLFDINNNENKNISQLMLIIYILCGVVIVLILMVLILCLLLQRAKTKIMNITNINNVQTMDVLLDDKQTSNVVDNDGDIKLKTKTNVIQQIQMESIGKGETEISSSDSQLFGTINTKQTKGVNDINTQ